MEWLEKMNRALDYIEENLDDEIDLEEVAKCACTSSYNFQRMFSFIADVSLADYIRRRRLSLAAMELLTTDEKVIDIALKYGYESPVSFSRAFYALHGINPSKARKHEGLVKSYPRISFQITIKGVEAMNYRIENLKQFRLVGYKERMNFADGENLKRIPEFWDGINNDGKWKKLSDINDNKKLSCMGVCANGDSKGFDYYIATGSDKDLEDGMEEIIVKPSTYVIFECIGKMPEGQQNVWKRIFTEWFPTSNYDIAEGPQMEWYGDGDPSSDTYKSEIWIPVTQKK